MDDLIQILIVVGSFVVFIISAIRKQKKKPLIAASSAEESIASVFGLNTYDDDKFVDRNTNSYMNSEAEASNIGKEKAVNDKQTIDNKKQVLEYIDDIEDCDYGFDLRSAVIYSEILNRKNF
ncbi:MAG: hypothetical protein JEZ09_07535 [Salinivirgaceae bacterium]|nr:hypothetical protein [Salinivirgaceae bacterium]